MTTGRAIFSQLLLLLLLHPTELGKASAEFVIKRVQEGRPARTKVNAAGAERAETASGREEGLALFGIRVQIPLLRSLVPSLHR